MPHSCSSVWLMVHRAPLPGPEDGDMIEQVCKCTGSLSQELSECSEIDSKKRNEMNLVGRKDKITLTYQ